MCVYNKLYVYANLLVLNIEKDMTNSQKREYILNKCNFYPRKIMLKQL